MRKQVSCLLKQNRRSGTNIKTSEFQPINQYLKFINLLL